MKVLSRPYRCAPQDAKCYYRQDDECFFHSLHQRNLYLRHYSAGASPLLSVVLVCRTQALGGDWHRRVNPRFLNVTYIHSGETQVRIGNRSFLAETGDLVLFPPDTDYEFGSLRGSVRSGIVVRGEILESVMRHFGGRLVFPAADIPHAAAMVERFFAEETAGERQFSSWCFELLSSLPSGENAISRIPHVLGSVMQKMQKGCGKRTSLAKLSEGMGVTPRTLTRMFQKNLHISPHQYLMALRMEKAWQMLAMEEFSIKEIAASVGYPNALNFSTEFRKVFGCSPSQYRTRKGEKSLPESLRRRCRPVCGECVNEII